VERSAATGPERPARADRPFRDELLPPERLAAKARDEARAATTRATVRLPSPLGALISRTRKGLEAANRFLSTAAREGVASSAAVEWLLDNSYLVDDQIKTAAEALAPLYGAELPRLTGGPDAGYPRIWRLAKVLIAHTDSRFDMADLTLFVDAYQEVSPLTMSETWSLPIVLRLALADNVRRLGKRVIVDLEAGRAAEKWAERIIASLDEGSGPAEAALADLESRIARTDLGAPFLVRLAQRLSAAERDVAPAVRRIERAFALAGVSVDTVVATEHRLAASDQVSIANAVTSIRFVEATDWRGFFERTSMVERVLRADPARVYQEMDFDSRDRYRHVVERLAKRTARSETDVAGLTVRYAGEALLSDGGDLVRGHVGWYLVGEGLPAFEARLRGKPASWPSAEARQRRGGAGYGAMLAGVALLGGAGLGWYASLAGARPWAVAAFVTLGLVPVLGLATDLVNRVAAVLWPPDLLPKLDARQPIGEAHRTLVVVPTLLSSPEAVARVCERLEIHMVANRDPNIHFALLGDLKAAPEAEAPGDAAVIGTARDAIAALNEAYGAGGAGPFHLFLRSRRFSAPDGTWMGWERKRGALTELNHYLRGTGGTSITTSLGNAEFLPQVVFVITLDADTVLPTGTARSLVSAIAHPLNRAHVDPGTLTVTRGYGVIQPRVCMDLVSALATRYSVLNAGPTGIDQYSGAVSDTYQDVFGEGSFTGKGIYEVDVFNAILDGRIPDNALLSHDLLEGNFLRCALASDLEVLDDYPPDYGTQCSRLHRWTRGDWQTSPWLFGRVRGAGGAKYRNPLGALHKWKIIDNLRRSLAPAAFLLWGLAGWLLLPRPGMFWIPVLVLLWCYPLLLHAVDTAASVFEGNPLRALVRPLLAEARADGARALLTLAFLPHQAHLLLDAAARALWRMHVSHRRMLEWTTAAEAQASGRQSLVAYVALMWPAAAVSVAAIAAIGAVVPMTAVLLSPLAVLWLASPAIAFGTSRPAQVSGTEDLSVTAEQAAHIRAIARRTWRFFETFVGPEDSWLPPDNFQEDPEGVVAHRTSPTNIGLVLLATITAHDLGYLSLSGAIERVSATMRTMGQLDRHHGHFYNWYDTVTLRPLRPRYLSTVDSGNLAGHLLVLRAALEEAAPPPGVGGRRWVVVAARRGLAGPVRGAGPDPAGPAGLRQGRDEIVRRATLAELPRSLAEWHAVLHGLRLAVTALETAAADAEVPEPVLIGASKQAAEAVRGHLASLETLAPWAAAASHPPPEVPDDVVALLSRNGESLRDLAEPSSELLSSLDGLADGGDTTLATWARLVAEGLRDGAAACGALDARIAELSSMATLLWDELDLGLVYDPSRELFSIGYNAEIGRCDDSYYDMLASECRLTSYLAVARGDVPVEHWFRLGRLVTRTGSGFALLSWSASMFEYLMPLLVMGSWRDTLLGATYDAVVKRQIEYGAERGVPWGVSESAFNARDAEETYQYQAFGVPGLGLKRGLSDDVVVAPYATMLAAQVDLGSALANLARLADDGALGRYGYYESIDYTPGRVAAGASRSIVRTYMAHHQGMGLVALGNGLTGDAMQRRFASDPLVASAELLLQERVPRIVVPAHPHVEEVEFVRARRELPPPVARSYPTPHTPAPATHFLSNGRYSVMVTNAGGGYSRWGDLAVTRYREDITRDCWGQYLLLRDTGAGRTWSATHQPTCAAADDYHCTFSADRAEYRRRDGDLETYTEVTVSPEDDIEVRRVAVTNHGRTPVSIEVTSYFEVALAPQGADQAHRAFSDLFVETEWLPGVGAVLFTRRPRSDEEPRSWGVHVVAGDTAGQPSVETDRERFIGRCRQLRDASAAQSSGPLSGTTGAVLDPVCSIRVPVDIRPGETARLAFSTGVAASRDDAVGLAEKYRDIRSAQRAIDLAWGTSEIELRDFGIEPDEAVIYQRLASRLLLTDPYSTLKRKTRRENHLPVSALWGLGISGDHPVLLVRIERLEDAHFVRQMLEAHQYWRHQGFRVDLVVLNTKPSAYVSELDARLKLLVRTGHALQMLDRPGGVFLRQADQIDPDVVNLLESVARVTLDADAGPIKSQLDRRSVRPQPPVPFVPRTGPIERLTPQPPRPALERDNGYGGIDPSTGEYVIVLEKGDVTPAPWVNVIASPEFGTMVSEAGVGCTWAHNSHENRLTTWNNDPVSDGSGELFYVRDEDTGEFWSPTPLPVRDDDTYVIRHGRGYSIFEHATRGIAHRLEWFVPVSDPVRVAELTLTNLGDTERTLSVTHFVEWVLGDSRSKANQRVSTAYDTKGRMLVARSPFNEDFPDHIAFLGCDRKIGSYTADRTEFLGRNGTPASPAAMRRVGLGGLTGRFHDNCGALMTQIALAPGQTSSVRFLLGESASLDEARELVERHRAPDAAQQALAEVREQWSDILDSLTVSTPDAALDAMANGRALYQALACRIWGRTALYQSSGAFGFRDQLQDVTSLLLARPDLARAHIVEASRHQFEEGDVLHWWQPHSGRGVRTRFRDDRLWLPFVTADYIDATGDVTVLDETTAWLVGPPVPDDREDLYLVPQVGTDTASVYEHCLRAFEASRGTGAHGLPLIGGGDWNDGMNRVGREGRGESVWLAWFLITALRRFAPLCEARGDGGLAADYREWADRLVTAVEAEGWDGDWYRRAYFDDGTALGTRAAEECRIDAIAQAWAVISGAGDPERARMALDSVDEKLVRREDGLIALLAPPFDHMTHDPGYIKGYVPGVRENGGQYTHAALWVVMAYALMGDGDEAVGLLDMINPFAHATTREAADVYRVEPYVVVADVYAVSPHVGRGGWSWYTGSAALFHTTAVRTILGFRTAGDGEGGRVLIVEPTIPKTWPGFSATLKLGGTTWRISVENPRGANRGVAHTTLDGRIVRDGRIPLAEDGDTHDVVVTMLGG